MQFRRKTVPHPRYLDGEAAIAVVLDYRAFVTCVKTVGCIVLKKTVK